MAFILTAKEATFCTKNEIGGKAFHLINLAKFGIVPSWLVIPTNIWKTFLETNNLHFSISKTIKLDSFKKLSKEIQDQILNADFSKELKDIISTQIYQNFTEENFLAIRSSVTDEDGLQNSFAGQMESYLFVKGIDNILVSIKKCWASAFSVHALTYRIKKGISIDEISIAVIIQQMINGEKSGVLFTANPTNGNRKEAYLTACFGLGEGIVNGTCNTDETTFHYQDQSINTQIVEKDLQIVFDEKNDFGTIEIPIPKKSQNQRCLTNKEITTLTEIGQNIQTFFGIPQDIEWTISNNQIYLLQTRPITILPNSEKEEKKLVWDNSNIQESYCGVTTPLTFSFAQNAYATVYRQTMKILKISPKIIQEHENMLNNLLGILNGRIYYNINNWYKGLLLLPSFQKNKEDMEKMMGLQDPVDFIYNTHFSFWEKIKKLPQMLFTLISLLSKFKQIDKLVTNFLNHFEEEYQKINRSELSFLSLQELMKLLDQLNENLLKKWHTPIINDFYVMMYNGKVRRFLEETSIDNPTLLQNQLLAGEKGIESTEPTKFLLRLSKKIKNDNVLITAFLCENNQQILHRIQQIPTIYNDFLIYIEKYGDRCIGELKLESISYRENPLFVITLLKNYVKKEELSIDKFEKNEEIQRKEAEKKAFSLIKKSKFKNALTKFRKAIKYRENMRLARTRMFGLYRSIYLEIGNRLVSFQKLEEAHDIFYLSIQEIEAYYDGRSIQSNLRTIIKSRKKEYNSYEEKEPPHHFYSVGTPYSMTQWNYPFETTNDFSSEELQGIACYQGIVKEEIKLIFSHNEIDDVNNKILCTVRTDPGWAALFPSSSGIIVERGSTLSHSAVVARELGIPAIVGVPNLTKILKNNEIVEMNGGTGKIKRLEVRK